MKSSYNIFSTPVWHIGGIPQPLRDELYYGAYNYKERYESTTKSNQGGYQSPSFNFDEFHPKGIVWINRVLVDVFDEIKVNAAWAGKDYYEKIDVTTWWYNINGKEHWNMPHTHPGSDLALVLYLTQTDNLLSFINPFSSRRIDGLSEFSVNTQKGDILIFPADVVHFVMPNPREEDRISISMNLQLC